MPSTQTFFRLLVMVGIGVMAVKGWHLYGPTNEQVKKTVTQAVEVVQGAINSRRQSTADTALDPRLAPAASNVNQPAVTMAPAPAILPSPTPTSQAEAPKLLMDRGASSISPTSSADVSPPAGPTDRLPELMSRLQKLGAADTNLAPWGSDGHMYRFSCRAPLASAPAMTQHFESVADQPTIAVEQVLAKVEAWQVAQRDGGKVRY
jgi:hypothetical protein